MILVHLDDGSVHKVKGDRWTEPSEECVFIRVLRSDRKIASFSPTEVTAIYDEEDGELVDDDAD